MQWAGETKANAEHVQVAVVAAARHSHASSRRRIVLQAADNSLSDRFSHPALTVLNPNISRRLNALTAHYTAADASRITSAFFADLGGRGIIDVVLQVCSQPNSKFKVFQIHRGRSWKAAGASAQQRCSTTTSGRPCF